MEPILPLARLGESIGYVMLSHTLHQLFEFLLNFPPNFWTFVGTALLMSRMMFVRSRTFIFTGLGAYSTAIFLNYGFIELPDFFRQFIAFASCSFIWAIILILPMVLYGMWYDRNRGYIGLHGRVYSQHMEKGRKGVVRVRGINMPARIKEDSAISEAFEDDEVRITDAESAVLIIEPLTVPMPTKTDLKNYRSHIKTNPLRNY